MGFRIGIDVGGTFTDFLVIDEQGKGQIYKTLSTPKDPSLGVFRGFQSIAEDRGMELADFLSQTDIIVHGTTITTNTVLTGKGAKTGLITTKGFIDNLEMRRGIRERLYDNMQSPPKPLVPRRLRIGVEERVNYAGDVLISLKKEEVREAIKKFRDEGVEAVAVSLLFSFLYRRHEERIGEIIKEELPEVYLWL